MLYSPILTAPSLSFTSVAGIYSTAKPVPEESILLKNKYPILNEYELSRSNRSTTLLTAAAPA